MFLGHLSQKKRGNTPQEKAWSMTLQLWNEMTDLSLQQEGAWWGRGWSAAKVTGCIFFKCILEVCKSGSFLFSLKGGWPLGGNERACLEDTMSLNLVLTACRDQPSIAAQLMHLGWLWGSTVLVNNMERIMSWTSVIHEQIERHPSKHCLLFHR